MQTRELKNYGKSYAEMLPCLPRAVRKRIHRAASRKIRRRLGIWGSLRLLVVARRRERQFQAVDLTPVRERGLVSEDFIREMIRNAALFSAMEERVGQGEARAVFHEIMDEVSRPMNEAILPSAEALGDDEDACQAFRDYFLAFFEAEKRDGLHAYEVVEDSEKAIAINVTYCAFCEIPRLLGVVEACDPSCYSDEVFFPGYLEPMGLRFARTKTLARGGDCCDFRFEKTEGQSPRRTRTRDG
ncbi:MAG: L-2-amino-thiazoline-4-carboxylic acid hydrolase [Deltaproteobacteria bacterium]|nr:L-2-amino-thiazoline-4-carboxylic acid hydrolase [Deltaproteobacteria bacterium]